MSKWQTNRAVQAQHDDHEEEDNGKKSSSRHICYGFCINDEQQTGTWKERRDAGQKLFLRFSFSHMHRMVYLGSFFMCCPTSIFGHSIHILLPHLGHVAQHSEDDKAGQKASQAVHRAGDQSISEIEKEEVWAVRKRQS